MADLDTVFEWNPFYNDLDLDTSLQPVEVYDPLQYGEPVSSPLASPVQTGFLYECATCNTAHFPTLPCNGNYSVGPGTEFPEYSLSEPLYVEKSVDSTITANYRKWLLSVSP